MFPNNHWGCAEVGQDIVVYFLIFQTEGSRILAIISSLTYAKPLHFPQIVQILILSNFVSKTRHCKQTRKSRKPMAKKAKRKLLRASRKALDPASPNQQFPQPWNASVPTQILPRFRPPRGVAQAHTKHAALPPAPTSRPPLGDRFHALPAELRAHIFSLLLVRPVKWQLTHHLHCPLLPSTNHSTPRKDAKDTCVRCVGGHDHQRIPLWRSRQSQDLGFRTWRHPWRSEWAEEVGNEFMCSDCWDAEFRPRPHPAEEKIKRHLRCLCARRRDLGVLMVCKQWHAEAGAVFYAQNTFAFEDATTFISFVSNLPSRWRERISRVSMMAYHPSDAAESRSQEERESGWEGTNKLRPIWHWLRQLPSLSYLELDAHFLTRVSTVQAMLRLGLRNVHRVCFTVHNAWIPRSAYVWPEYHEAKLLVGGLAEEVARAIKGQRRAWLKRPGAIERAAEVEKEYQETAMELSEDDELMGRGNVCYCGNFEEWQGWWWALPSEHRSAHHAYLGDRYAHLHSYRPGWRERHWREWNSSCVRFAEGVELARNSPPVDGFGELEGWGFLLPIETDVFQVPSWHFLENEEGDVCFCPFD